MPTPDAVQTLNPQATPFAQTLPFAHHGDPGAPGACFWCGTKLRLAKVANHPTIDGYRTARGDYGDNAFCTLRCGYSFGVELAIRGHRLRLMKP